MRVQQRSKTHGLPPRSDCVIVVKKGADICRKPAVCWALSKHHLIQSLLCKAGVIVPILQMSKLWSQEVMLPQVTASKWQSQGSDVHLLGSWTHGSPRLGCAASSVRQQRKMWWHAVTWATCRSPRQESTFHVVGQLRACGCVCEFGVAWCVSI